MLELSVISVVSSWDVLELELKGLAMMGPDRVGGVYPGGKEGKQSQEEENGERCELDEFAFEEPERD